MYRSIRSVRSSRSIDSQGEVVSFPLIANGYTRQCVVPTPVPTSCFSQTPNESQLLTERVLGAYFSQLRGLPPIGRPPIHGTAAGNRSHDSKRTVSFQSPPSHPSDYGGVWPSYYVPAAALTVRSVSLRPPDWY